MATLLAFLASVALNYLIIYCSSRFGWMLNESDLFGEQKFHFSLVPRVSGIAVFVGFFSGVGYVNLEDFSYFYLFLSSLPLFIFGIFEDITGKLSPMKRMAGIFLSIIFAFFSLDIGITTLGFDSSDYILSISIFSLLFTLLVVSGVVNSLNIIDGYNGLMAGYSILVLLSILYVANIVGDDLVMRLSLPLLTTLAGFFIFNFPFGKVFMGDGGAYFVGFLISIIGLVLAIRNDSVSHWFVLLLLIYPLYETVFSIYRKKFLFRASPSQPDGYHLHMLVYKRLSKAGIFENNKVMQNSATSPFLWIFSLVGIVPAIIWHNNQFVLIVWAFVFMALYTLIYGHLAHFKLISKE